MTCCTPFPPMSSPVQNRDSVVNLLGALINDEYPMSNSQYRSKNFLEIRHSIFCCSIFALLNFNDIDHPVGKFILINID